jgi:hypothetical protein
MSLGQHPGSIDCPLAIVSAVANRRVDGAVAAVDGLIDFMNTMFEGMESGLDPSLLDCSIEPLPGVWQSNCITSRG